VTSSPALEILDRAGDILEKPTASTASLWPKAAAVLARQALEQGLRERLSVHVPGIERANVRVQLLCLLSFMEDSLVAQEVSLTWWALSRACHHHSYELAPTASELATLIDAVGRFVRSA
jgi:hypothetical protein